MTENRAKVYDLLPKDLQYVPKLSSVSALNNKQSKETDEIKCLCINDQGELIKCTKCNKSQHLKCIGAHSKLKPYICPACALLKINPLDFPAESLVEPWVVQQNIESFPWFISCAERIIEYKNDTKKSIEIGKGKIQIQIRCLKLDGMSYTMTWPSNGLLLVNGKIAMKFEIPANINAKKRKDEPLNITTILNSGSNAISLIKYKDPNIYVACVYIVWLKSEDELIEEIYNTSQISVEEGKDFIKKILHSNDEDLVPDSIRFSLKCPFTYNLLEIPTRGVNCNHIQCFNLPSYIKMQRASKVNRWRCPICKGYVYDMVIDNYLAQIMKECQLIEDAEKLEIFSNAGYKILTSALANKKKDKNMNVLIKKQDEQNEIELPKKKTREEIEYIIID
ncbi:hypothetical protein SteCoe_17474 [Stentor coeruleus]|uniref:SP-RING-type domain-containing protein n=1 Tax=Stentor coeruleus TaxID=5963 RepID=A0A1R2BYR6_9CILI|nr:hypothetical protein SteCoe_17474 [Stentor coeruleus]